MTSFRCKPRGSAPRPADIVGVNPVLIGAYVILRCQDCDHTFESYQPTLVCVALRQHSCPNCQAVYEVWPEGFQAALDRHLPPLSWEEMTLLTAEATRIAENWYRVGPLARWLTYKGLNLGEPTERALVAFIAQGLYIAYSRRVQSE